MLFSQEMLIDGLKGFEIVKSLVGDGFMRVREKRGDDQTEKMMKKKWKKKKERKEESREEKKEKEKKEELDKTHLTQARFLLLPYNR